MVGALVAYGLARPGAIPAVAAGRAALEETQALKENVVQARVELAALKLSIDSAYRNTGAQLGLTALDAVDALADPAELGARVAVGGIDAELQRRQLDPRLHHVLLERLGFLERRSPRDGGDRTGPCKAVGHQRAHHRAERRRQRERSRQHRKSADIR